MTTRPKNHPAVEAVARSIFLQNGGHAHEITADVIRTFANEARAHILAFLDAIREPSQARILAAAIAEADTRLIDPHNTVAAALIAAHNQIRKEILHD